MLNKVSFLFRYLHEACSPPVIHKNVKSSNVLLDADLNPHLGDCGLGFFYEVCVTRNLAEFVMTVILLAHNFGMEILFRIQMRAWGQGTAPRSARGHQVTR